jgi:uncharacterized repeat protein (TIGR02543 family)
VAAIANPFSRTGYTFAGWTENANGSGTAYSAGDIYTFKASGNDLYAQWTAIRYTVTYAPGAQGTWNAADRRTGNLTYGAPTPAAPTGEQLTHNTGYTFAGWAPLVANTVTGTVIYTALWEAVIVPPPVDPPVEPPVDPPEPPIDDPDPEKPIDEPLEPEVVPQTPAEKRAETLEQLKEAGVPILKLGNMEIPLVGKNNLPVWALVNLILMLLGLILAVVTSIRAARRRKDEGDDEEQRKYREDDEEERDKKVRPIWLIATIVLALAGLLFFLLTEDMDNLMVFFDKWTPISAILFVATFIGNRLTFKKEEEEEQPEDREAV